MQPSMLAVAVAILTTGCLAGESLSAPDGATVDATGVVVSQRDNPFLTGNVYLTVASESPGGSLYTQQKTFSPDGAYLSADRPGLFDWQGVDRGWLSADLSRGAIPIGAPSFLAPAIRLPVDYGTVTLTLTTVRGRELSEPAPPGTIPPPIGFDVEQIDTQQIRLDPNVLVLPVRVTVLLPVDGSVPPRYPPDPAHSVSSWFDPGLVSLTRVVSRVDSGLSSQVEVPMGHYLADGSTAGYGGVPPDSIWTQCGIQFRLEEVELAEQQLGLETQLLPDCLCRLPRMFAQPNRPVTEFVADGRDGSDMLQIFIGGEISGLDCPFGTTYGLACGAPTNERLGCPPTVDTTNANVIFLDGTLIDDRPRVITHELGHMLGLNHPSDAPQVCTDVSAVGGDNIMSTGAVGASLTPQQCERARCIALQWLDRFGRVPPGHTAPDSCAFF